MEACSEFFRERRGCSSGGFHKQLPLLFRNLAFEVQPNSLVDFVFLLIHFNSKRDIAYFLVHFSVHDEGKFNSKAIELKNFMRLFRFQ